MHFDTHFFTLFSKLASKTARKPVFTGISNALRLLERDEWILLDKDHEAYWHKK